MAMSFPCFFAFAVLNMVKSTANSCLFLVCRFAYLSCLEMVESMIVHCFLCHPLPFQPVHHDSLRFCSWLTIIPKAMWSSSIRERHTITFLPIIKDQDMCFQWYCHDLWYYNTSTNAYALYSSEHIEFKVWNFFPPCCILPGHGKTSCMVLQNNPLYLTEFLSQFFFSGEDSEDEIKPGGEADEEDDDRAPARWGVESDGAGAAPPAAEARRRASPAGQGHQSPSPPPPPRRQQRLLRLLPLQWQQQHHQWQPPELLLDMIS